MTGVQFASYIRQKTRQDSTTLTDAAIVALGVGVQEDIVKEITKVNEDYFGIALLRNLVAGQRNYAFPSDILSQMKYLEAQLDGTEWERLTETDLNSLGINTDEDSIQEYYADKDPQFDIMGGEIYILSGDAIISVTSGLKLWAFIYPPTLTTAALASANDLSVPISTTAFGYMPHQLHRLWADAIVVEWKQSQDKPVGLTDSEGNWENRMRMALDSMKGSNLDRAIIASVPDDDGQNY
ncbi:MAG: hypothetical protein COY66_04990 [Candidatus Kerfeldbacteria bacterium CG_4_10_14_0_8_um_filter_42_10]|uniref:Uncharacterized protein n=1 Tax=Candidatus Kerfeldbacteria bacterium CG_4_10_14_0_8_um_filter_42_10 TaxID=2014248 RepID=A0A2M7RHV7_9BACT|nr:MAG: hypothetical protein COY66_04990 [Candidatus Kerfeldbacteria bacterium CG_4_10_14_0_8_um_filter_42_10]